MQKPQFQPVSCSWVALHPQPKGVIQFVGGALFGTWPTLSYRHLLHELYNAGYTVVAMPFRFSFRHWAIALDLLEEQRQLQTCLADLADRLGYASDLYQRSDRYSWLGHSLGCKYIALLELLCGVSLDQSDTTLESVVGDPQAQWLRDRLRQAPTIWNQPAQLLAPDISDTPDAVPVKPLAHLLDALGLGVTPTRSQTLELITRSRLFNLTTLISFAEDTVAGSIQDPRPETSDVRWLYQHLQPKGLIHAELAGKHLEPVGIKIGTWLVDLNPLDKFAKPLNHWSVSQWVLDFWGRLKTGRAAAPLAPPGAHGSLPAMPESSLRGGSLSGRGEGRAGQYV